MPGGATTICLSDHMRSKMSARAITDARIRGQIGQPAACMIDHTDFHSRRLAAQGVHSSVATAIRQGEAAQAGASLPQRQNRTRGCFKRVNVAVNRSEV